MSALALWPPFPFDPLIGEARTRARRRRLLVGTVLVVLGAGAALAATFDPLANGSPRAGAVSDGALRTALPAGWSASVGPGFDRTHPVAWMSVGDFPLPQGAARIEGGPRVPAGRVLLAIGEFFPDGPSRHWPMVSSLRMPRALIVTRRWWSVRYAGRAVSIQVTFGSGQTPTLVDQVQRLLVGIHRVGRA